MIVAAILGGTSLTGGQGSVLGTLVGALIVGTVNNGLNLLGVQSFWQSIVQGLILVGAVALDALVQRRRGRPLSDRRRHPAARRSRRAGKSGDMSAPCASGWARSSSRAAGRTRTSHRAGR